MTSASSRTTGKARRSAPGALAGKCWCDGMEVSPVHLFPAGRRHRMLAGLRRTDLRARAPRHVCAGRRQRLRPQFQRPRGRRQGHLWRRVPAGRAGIFALQFRACRHRLCCCSISRTPRPSARRCSTPSATTRRRQRPCIMALPAYDQCIKASHVFNLLDARGVISVTERQSYILARPRSVQGLRRSLPADGGWRPDGSCRISRSDGNKTHCSHLAACRRGISRYGFPAAINGSKA